VSATKREREKERKREREKVRTYTQHDLDQYYAVGGQSDIRHVYITCAPIISPKNKMIASACDIYMSDNLLDPYRIILV
jgi:hypothetical protein